jgi:hypothetical protein
VEQRGLTDPAIEILEDLGDGEGVWLLGAPDDAFHTAIIEPEALILPVAESMRRLADRTGATVDSAVFRWHRRWARFARVGDIRSQSRIRLHAWTPLPDLIERLGDSPLDIVDHDRHLLRSEGPLRPARRGAYRTAATLSLRWSWPHLPVWIVAEPWWRDHTVITLSLRSNRRLRYPRRYWDGAYRALRGVVLDGAP